MDVNVWAQQLIDQLHGHMDNEREALTAYGELAENATDQHVRFLMQMILDDELRHHRLFDEMAKHLRREVEQRGESAIPELRRGPDREHVQLRTKELLALEREDIKELRKLRKDVQKVADTEWWSALIDVMESDNRKHIRLLEYVRDHA